MKFKSNIESQAGIEDSAGSAGTDGKILSSLGVDVNGVAGVEWIDQGDVVAGEADKAKSVILRVKNSTLSAMTKGQVICENVSISPPSGNLIEVALADNNAAGRMPALGILNEDLDAAGGNNDEGDAIMFGKVSGIDTSAFQVGDEVFVSDAPGGLTTTKPTGVKYIQKVGVVIRDDNTNGTIEVFGAGRVNDVPTPLYVDHANQRLGIGVTNPGSKLTVDGTTHLGGDVEVSDGLGGDKTLTLNANIGHFSIGDIDGLGDQAFISGNSSSISISTNQITTLRCDSNNRVGIGTTSPSEKLTVRNGTSNTDVKILAYNSAAGTEATLKFSTIASETNYEKAAIIARNAAGSFGRSDMHFALDSALDAGNVQFSDTKMTILNGGNVGIGETDPESKLHIKTPTASSSDMLLLENYGWAANMTTGIAFKNGGNYTGQTAKIYTIMNGSGNQGGEIRFSTLAYSGTNPNPNTTLIDRMTIDDLGNVGINTTDPKTKLHVASASSSDAPTAGTATGGLFVSNTNKTYGINMGVSGGGWSFIQGQRADGNTTLYNLNLQPLGGNVGIGATSPSELLHLRSTGPARLLIEADSDNVTETDNAQIILKQDGGAVVGRLGYRTNTNDLELLNEYSSNIYLGTSNSIRATLHANGNFGIGNSTPQAKLHVSNGLLRTWSPSSGTSAIFESTVSNRNFVTLTAANEAELWFGNAATQTLGRVRYEMANNNMEFWTNGAQKMVINSSGNVGIGETAPSSKLYIQGSTSTTSSQLMRIRSTASSTSTPLRIIEFIRSSYAVRGYISMNQYGVQYNTSSDYRLKENITPINDALDRLNKLKPNRFSWKEGPSDYKVDGFIAHEVAEVIPEAVSGEKDAVDENNKPSYQGIDQAKIVPLLTAALQEAVSKIEQLETRIQNLENK